MCAPCRKLQEVKERLDELKDLVQYYQSGNQFSHGSRPPGAEGQAGAQDNDQDDQSSLPMLSDYEDPQLMKNLRCVGDSPLCFF